MKLASFVLPTMLLLASGCNNNSTAPTDTTPQPYTAGDAFFGTLSPQGSQFGTFNVLQSATTTITLASVTTSGTRNTLSTPLTLLLGSLSADGSDCVGTTTVTATPALTAHVRQDLTVATYCVKLSDPGNLASAVDFGVVILQMANTQPVGSAGTDTFSSNLYPQGAATRTFPMSQPGEARVVLTGVSPAASIGIGLGMTSDGNNCFLNQAVVTTPGSGAELSAIADTGRYCVRAFDPGGLADRVTFTAQITHQ